MVFLAQPKTIEKNTHQKAQEELSQQVKKTLKNEYKPKKYKVYFDIFNNKIFMKPYLKYCEFEFEHLFHFKRSCQDYNQNRIIFI